MITVMIAVTMSMIRVNGMINEIVKMKINVPIGDVTGTVAVQSQQISHVHTGVTFPRQ